MSFQGRRLLREMAGVSLTQYERSLMRLARRARRAEQEGREQLALIDMIQRRERGEEGTKPMPFAKPNDETESP